MDTNEHCIICNSHIDGEELIVLHRIGAETVRRCSEERCDTIFATSGSKVHSSCRKKYCNPKTIQQFLKKKISVDIAPATKTRSTGLNFNITSDCMFCAQLVTVDERHVDRSDGWKIRTKDFDCSIRKICNERNDEWSMLVLSRLNSSISDLHAADAVYHNCCSVNFRTGKLIPSKYDVGSNEVSCKRRKLGKPVDVIRTEAYDRTIEYFMVNDDTQFTLKDFSIKMSEFLIDEQAEPYGLTFLRARLYETLGDGVVITNHSGKEGVVTFRQTAESILNEYHNMPNPSSVEDERDRIITAAAKIIKNEMKEIYTPMDSYPGTETICDVHNCLRFIPPALQLLLSLLVTCLQPSLKIASIGQAIIQASRPRAILAPLQIASGIQLHSLFWFKISG